jgi:predicted PurR-regulated permease PerM
MSETPFARDLTRTTLGVLLAGASLWVMRPFLLPLVWAATIVIATWPVLTSLQRRLWGRRWLAASIMVALLLLVFLVPASLAIAAVIANADRIRSLVTELGSMELPLPPAWVADLPLVGTQIKEQWTRLASSGPEGLGAQVAPYARDIVQLVLHELERFGLLLLDFFLAAVLAAILYLRGEIAAAGVRRFAGRLAGAHGEEVVELAGRAFQSVALGVVVTALLQSIAGGIGLLVAGVPGVGLLTGVMFLLSIAQIGAVPVMAIATVWLFLDGATGTGILLAAWTIAVGAMDNVIRPLLIRRGVQLPLLLIFAGVIGGLIAFGVIFVGPVLLAVTYTLLGAWVRGGEAPAAGTIAAGSAR